MATTKKYAWFIEIIASGDERLAIVENTPKTVGNVTDNWQAIQTTGTAIRMEYHTIQQITSLTSSIDYIEERYLKGIVNKAISDGYKDPRNLDIQLAQFFEGEYVIAVKKAKKHAKSGYVSTGNVIPQEF